MREPSGARSVYDERSTTDTERSEYCCQRHASNATHSRISEDTVNTANRNTALSAVGKYPSLGEETDCPPAHPRRQILNPVLSRELMSHENVKVLYYYP
jgi:hypothetical protein